MAQANASRSLVSEDAKSVCPGGVPCLSSGGCLQTLTAGGIRQIQSEETANLQAC